ncbi:hypothetical protein GCM10011391_40070 [Pullulanibacillus camelliae]|uniref:Uncharacterized protein n=1 Tax=Pullulanibacillus camelliae TaxID=1707096 RepID=A0A8J3E036_9BACL|nr:hypothetical protein [Pullulanibacillus camelliae]GGE57163.1 hypothetical protein GCM10011391_40070 [Pullulanibacillus camelliae]
MRCGAKCFVAEMEVDGQKQVRPVTARTPADVRKTIRLEYGTGVTVLSVKEKRK